MIRPASLYLLFLILTAAAGCRKDEIIDKTTVEEDGPVVLTISSFKGKIIDQSGAPVAGATVKLYNNATVTDAAGWFSLKNIKSPKDAALLRVSKQGYFESVFMADNQSGGNYFVSLALQGKGIPQQIDAGTGGTLLWPGGLKTIFKGGVLTDKNGFIYKGVVNVYAKTIPSSQNSLSANLAVGEDKKTAFARPFAMAVLAVEDAAGEPLFVKEGEKISLETPIAPEALDNAPSEAPLWYFDIEEERWLIQGKCKREGNVYQCSIGYFSYCACALSAAPACLSAQVFQPDSVPAAYLKVLVEDLTSGAVYWGFTDVEGRFCGAVPRNTPLRLSVEDLCGQLIDTFRVGILSKDFEMPPIYLHSFTSPYKVRISGNALDCAALPVSLGQVAVEYPGRMKIVPIFPSNGAFVFELDFNCLQFPELQISAYDLKTFQRAPLIVRNDAGSVQINNWKACETPSDSFRLEAGGRVYRAAPTRFYRLPSAPKDWMVLEAQTIGGTLAVEIKNYTGPGVYKDNIVFRLNKKPDLDYPQLRSAAPNLSVTIASDDGAFIAGELAGTAYDDQNKPMAVKAHFRIKKAR